MQEKKPCRKIKKVSIIGVIPSFAFQRAKYCALELHRKLPQRFPLPEIIGLLELDWSEKLLEWKQTLGREYWCLRRPVAVFFDDRFIGSDIELIKLTSIGNILLDNVPRKTTSFLKERFGKDYVAYLKKTKRIYCYLDICVDEVYIGTLTFQLYSDLVPKTCENFKSLCLGSKGSLLTYKGSRIHRIVKKGWLQGGDIQYKTGGGGFSIFCDPLEDECFGISHDRRGVLSMASKGRHQNGSQFFITLSPSQWMDTHFVAFGQLIEGSKVLKILENIDTIYECPLKKIEIKTCGKLDLGDIEDVDVMYREETLPKKKPKKIETISEQIIRLIMEALTDSLAKKERIQDVLDDGDIPSKMNLQLFFQGFYSIPDSIVEDSARYLRKLRRVMYRGLKPSATEVVEVLMYDLLMAVLTRMTTLDDVKETIGHDLYKKLVGGINMKLELCQKPYVKRLVDQIVSTAESMVNLINKKLIRMKKMDVNLKAFQDRMQNWVQSFVLQETFQGDNYYIANRPGYDIPKNEEKQYPHREGIPCCEKAKKKKGTADLEKLKQKHPPEEICCLGSKLFDVSEIRLDDYFKSCRYDLKRVPKNEPYRMPLLELIEISRFKLKWMRKQENRQRTKERLCIEKKVRKWMNEVVYTPESSWIKDVVYERDEVVIDHVEEIMYGAMTAGLIEMYYFMEEYLKQCGGKKQRLVTRTVYPEDYGESSVDLEQEELRLNTFSMEKEEKEEKKEIEPLSEPLPPCTCGHPCCVCPFDPNYRPPSPPSVEEEQEEEEEVVEEEIPTPLEEPKPEVKPCPSGFEPIDLLAESTSLKPEEIDIRSFNWLKPYILEKGCDMKTEFATQVHKWMEGERFNYKGFLSKHSLVTRASLLSLSISLAELIKEENQMKTEIKNFVYDLWDLYFNEMFKEALLEFPPEEKEKEEEKVEEEEEEEEEMEIEPESESPEDKCKKIIEQTPDFDFTDFCARLEVQMGGESEESEENVPDKDIEEPVAPEPPETTKQTLPTEPEISKKKKKKSAKQEGPHLEGKDDASIKSDDNKGSNEDSESEEETGEDGKGKAQQKKEKKVRKKRSPYEIQELVYELSSDESRHMPPYVLPFWVKFLTELTKQVLGSIAKVSRLPRRLYFTSDSEMAFDDKMKDWFEFNAFNPKPTKGREMMDYIALHHKSLTNLEDTARSFLKKKKYSELLNRCTRITSADDVASEIITNVVANAMKQTEEAETVELYVSNLLSTALTSTPQRSESSYEDLDRSIETDQRESLESIEPNDD